MARWVSIQGRAVVAERQGAKIVRANMSASMEQVGQQEPALVGFCATTEGQSMDRELACVAGDMTGMVTLLAAGIAPSLN